MWVLLLVACKEPAPPIIAWERGSGTLWYSSWLDEEVWCDLTIELYVVTEDPVCVGCEFTLDVSAYEQASRGADDCVPDPRYSFREEWEDLRLGSLEYDPEYTCCYDGLGVYYDFALLLQNYYYFGFTNYYPYYYTAGPTWYLGLESVAEAGEELVVADHHLEWTISPSPRHADFLHDPAIADRIEVSAVLDFDPHYDTGGR